VRGLRTARQLGGIGNGKAVAGLAVCAMAAIITFAWLIASVNGTVT
jgi:hypothetical protein